MKKLVAIVLVAIMILALVACSGNTASNTEAKTETKTEAMAETKTETKTEAKTETETKKLDWPNPKKTLTVIVPFGAGGDTDLAARIIVDKLATVLGCTIVVENVPGGSGVIGHTQMLNSEPDGYTLLFNQLGSHVTQTQLGNTTYKYDDSSVICGMGSFPQSFVVKADSEWNTFQDMVDWAKAHPGELTYGTQGVGGLGHTCALDAFTQLGVDAKDVAFGNTAESVTAVLGGHVMLTCCPIAGSAPYINSGELKLLALSNKFYQYPDAPVVADYGCTDGMYSWIALFGQGSLDPQIVQILSDAVEETMKDPGVQEKLKDFGIETNFVPAEEFKKVMQVEYDRNRNALLAAGIIDK